VALSAVDRAFIAANVEKDEKHTDNPSTALQRFEFMEVIARLAVVKYKEPGICATAHESITKMLE
jgi:hypothetical protein